MDEGSPEHTYLTVPPVREMRSCVGLVLAGMAARARIGVGGLEEAVELLESYHTENDATHFRFSMGKGAVIAEVEETDGRGMSRWHKVVELVS